MIHIYYGYGKGKTSAAIGLGMRAYGAGKTVCLIQFLKDNKSSELKSVPFEVFESPESVSFNPDKSYQSWIDSALEYINLCEVDIIILDEFLDIIPEFCSKEKALELFSKDCELVITGHKEIPALFDKADYITHMDKIKHPYDKGVKARKGIEY
ncbi:MAG: cob(I)yrinic acid a,c-diamide adenosyltransferase [Eubacterium sp.]|nr:cob(I)yrinic acid a,c-diamide adenosyltransferase [Eubacterium sp.]